LYVLKTFNSAGCLIGRVEFRCGADDEAMTALHYLNEEKSSELWCGARLVTTWHAQMNGATPGRDAAQAKRGRGRPRSQVPIAPAPASA